MTTGNKGRRRPRPASNWHGVARGQDRVDAASGALSEREYGLPVYTGRNRFTVAAHALGLWRQRLERHGERRYRLSMLTPPRFHILLLAALGLLSACDSTTSPLEPGSTQYGTSGFIEYVAGDLPIILSAPHGGDLSPEALPDRTQGVVINDAMTQELTRAVYRALVAQTGRHPHVIINRLHRRKMDANRYLEEAAEGNAGAETAWTEFHAFTDQAKTQVRDDWGAGLYLDLHGHGHPMLRLELGYLLTRGDLNDSDARLDGAADRSSLRALASDSPLPFSALIRGPSSLGARLVASGVPAVPSDTDPQPHDDPYFTGGYNTHRHGSVETGTISAVQIEHHRIGLRDTAANREAYAERLAEVLVAFMREHYGFDFSADA